MAQTEETTEAPQTDFSMDTLRTKGIRQNRKAEFNIHLTGQEVYLVLETFEDLAVETRQYDVARKCVLLSELIRDQAKKQGF